MSGYSHFPQGSQPNDHPFGKPVSSNPFADQINPYAAPQMGAGYQAPNVSQHAFAGLWRQGNLLVMHKSAPIPDVCWLSNQPSRRRLKRTLHWHQPAIYIILLISPLIYIIVALIMQQKATIQLPLSEEWYARRRTRMLIAWAISLLLGPAMFVGGLLIGDAMKEAAVVLVMGGVLTSLAGLIYGLVSCRLITPNRITSEYAWVKGVHPEYLNRLEPWVWNI